MRRISGKRVWSEFAMEILLVDFGYFFGHAIL